MTSMSQRQQRERGQPVLAHIVAGHVRQAGRQVAVGGVLRRGLRRIAVRQGRGDLPPAPGARRFRPSRWAILPSLRSLTEAGRTGGRPLLGRSGRKRGEPEANSSRPAAGGAGTRPRSGSATGSRRRTAPRPGRRRLAVPGPALPSAASPAGRRRRPLAHSRRPGPGRRRWRSARRCGSDSRPWAGSRGSGRRRRGQRRVDRGPGASWRSSSACSFSSQAQP
jgi:hypothetical protein